MFEFFVTARYLKTRLIAAVSAVAIACAVVVAYVPNPVMEGFLTQLEAKVRGTSADVLVETEEIFDAEKVAAKAMSIDPRIRFASPRIEGTAIFSTGDSVDTFDCGQVFGVNPSTEYQVSHFGLYLENAGTQACRPFEMKPETLLRVIRRETAEDGLGREIVDAMEKGSRHAALRALARDLVVTYFPGPEDRKLYIERLIAKEYSREEAEEFAGEKDENTKRLLRKLAAREGRKAFIRLEAPEAERRVASVALPEGILESRSFLERLGEIRKRPGVLVGKSLLENWRELRLGEEIELLCGKFSGPLEARRGPMSRNLLAVIVGVYDSGFYDFDVRTIYMSLGDAEAFLEDVGPRRGLGLKIADWREAEDVRDVLQPAFQASGFRVSTWKQRKEVVLEAVKRQKQVLFVILFFADIVAGFGIFITLRILVAEKVRDIGVFSAIGARPVKVMYIFMLTGLSIALVGTIAGIFVGVGIVSLSNEIVAGLNWLGLSEFKSYIEDIQHLKRIPVEYRFGTLLKVLVATLVTAFLSSIYPAFLAARLKPVDAIRREFL